MQPSKHSTAVQADKSGYTLPEEARQKILAEAPGYKRSIEIERQRMEFVERYGNSFGVAAGPVLEKAARPGGDFLAHGL